MRRTFLVLAAVFATAALAAPAAFAASPHFIRTPTCTKNADFSLTCSGKAAGLGNLATDVFISSSGGTADLQCVNPGGNNPPPKRVSFGPLTGETVTITPRNGQITFSASLGPPDLPGAAELCPNPNWSVDVLSLTYFDVELHIQQGGVDILTFDFGTVDP